MTLRAGEPTLLEYLAEFYEVEEGARESTSWTVDAALGSGVGLPPPDRWGVACRADSASGTIVLRSEHSASLAVAVRKVIREVLIEHCEQRRYVMLHASTFARRDRIVIVAGDKGSGKTTLGLRSILDHGYQLISNDHLILFAEPSSEPLAMRLRLTSLPTPIPVKVGTYLDLEGRLPRPWDDEGIDLEAYRSQPSADRYRCGDARVMFTYRGLGQPNPVELSMGPVQAGPEVSVVLASYAAPDDEPGAPLVVTDPVSALWPHVRFDWVFDPHLNTRHLPRPQRSQDAYGADALRLVTALVERTEVISWAHHGDPSPLLAERAEKQGRSCVR